MTFSNNELGLIILFSGADTRGFTGQTTPGKPGAAEDGAEYYKVIVIPGTGGKGETDNIDGCYQKIPYHSIHQGNFLGIHPDDSGHKYPIYKKKTKKTGGALHLRINENKTGAPWTLADEEKNIKYE